jgi:hypothetical protein
MQHGFAHPVEVERVQMSENGIKGLKGPAFHQGVGAIPTGRMLDAHGTAQIAQGGKLHVELAGDGGLKCVHGVFFEQGDWHVNIPI